MVYNITCVMNCQSFWEMHLCYYYFWQKKKFLCSTILNHHLFSSLFDVLEGTAGFQLVLHKILLLESTLKCDCKIEILLLKVLNAHLASSCPIASSTWSETLNCLTGFVHSD